MTGHRILIVSPFVPAPWFGGGTRVFQLLRRLAAHHEVTLLTYGASEDEADVDVLRSVCHAVHVVSRNKIAIPARRRHQLFSLVAPTAFHIRELHTAAMQAALVTLTENAAFDVIQLEGSQLCSFRLPDGPATVLDEQNVEYEVLQRMSSGERTAVRRFFSGIEYRKFRRTERHWWRAMDGVAVTSDREMRIVAGHASETPVAVVPNCVDVEHFRPQPTPVDPSSIVFIGTLGYRPNVDAVEYLLDEILPEVLAAHPDAVLTVVGRGEERDLRRFRRPHVTVTGRVPDVRPYLARAAVAVVPVRIGGGTRLKIVEALAMGKAVVSTTIGCEGLAVRDGEHVLLADDVPGIARALSQVLSDAAMARRLGCAGRELVMAEYSWDTARERLERLYDVVLRSRRAVTSP